MRASNIKVSDLEHLQITNLDMKQEMGTHSKLHLEGYFTEGFEDPSHVLYEDKEITVYYMEEDKEEVLFHGIPYGYEIEEKFGTTYLSLTLVSLSMLMDLEMKDRSFQTAGTAISSIIELLGNEQKFYCYEEVKLGTTENVCVQYHETNWEFLKRVASWKNETVYPVVTVKNRMLRVGMLEHATGKNIQIDKVATVSHMEEMREKQSHNYQVDLLDSRSYVITSREVCHLGDCIALTEGNATINNHFVWRMHSYFEKEELINEYELRSKKGCGVATIYNKSLVGASLNGSVSGISGAKVSLRLDIDEGNALCGSKDFLYATIYSSPNGTGWYCMPETGDSVRLFFPTENEKDAYVISSVHVDAGNNSNTAEIEDEFKISRDDPNRKVFSNKDNKSVVLTSKGITISNNQGMVIDMNDDDGITIISDKGVYIGSSGLVQIMGAEGVSIKSNDKVIMQQQSGIAEAAIADWIQMSEGGSGEAVSPDEGETVNTEIVMQEGNIMMKGTTFKLQQQD